MQKLSILLALTMTFATACKKKEDAGAAGAGGGAGAAGPAGGPPCAEVAKTYFEINGSNDWKKLNPSAEETAALIGKLEANCTSGWSAATKTCVMGKPDMFKLGKCFGDAMASARVRQVIFDEAKELKAKRDAAGGTDGSAQPAGSADGAAAGSGSAG